MLEKQLNYPVFRESVKMALRAGLREMARNGNQIAILAPISGGIYSGKETATNARINSEYEQIINELLNEDYTPGVKLGSKFEDVIFPIYPWCIQIYKNLNIYMLLYFVINKV